MKGKTSVFGEPNSKGRWLVNVNSSTGEITYEFKNHIYPHNLPNTHRPNSTIKQIDDNGRIVRIRHYDDKGNAYKDVDYTDHGTPEIHKVPHTHEIIIKDGNIHKRKWGSIMDITKFKQLFNQGFDLEFNIGDIFYSVTSKDIEHSKIAYLGNEKKESLKFDSIDVLLKHKINNQTLEEIIKKIPDEEVYR